MTRITFLTAVSFITLVSWAMAQEVEPYTSASPGKDPFTGLFYGNMFYRQNVPFQGSPPEMGGGSQQTQYFYGPDGSFQGYSTQSGDTRHYYGGDGNYQGSSYQKSNEQNFYASDGRTKSGSVFYGR